VQARRERCFQLGRERVRAAESVYALEPGPRLTLLRDAATCFVAAILLGTADADDVDDLQAPAAWERLQRQIDGGALGPAPPELAVARRWLASPSPLDLPDGPGEATDALHAASAAVRWLAGLCDPRKATSKRRGKTGSVLLGVAIVLSIAGLGGAALAPRDLALGRPARSSSQPEKSNRRPAGLTNGILELTSGAETAEEDAPWFLVDLGQPTAIDRVVVANRGDATGAENLPLELALGDTPETLERVATRTTPFSRKEPWVEKGLGRTARYVRVRRTTKGPLVLDEIEVYR
jgi:hypothetical protein